MKIDYFIIREIKENIYYFVSLFLIIFITFFSLIFFHRQKKINEKESIVLKKDIKKLEEKTTLVRLKNHLEEENIDIEGVNKVLTQLIPNKEDYFSILYALDRLSKKTGFVITSYSINMSSPKKDTISIIISGQGDQDSFLAFLRDYNFSGRRLVAIDKIEFSTAEYAESKLNLSFFSGEAKTEKANANLKFSDSEKRFIREMIRKVTFNFGTEEENNKQTDEEYSTKKSPF